MSYATDGTIGINFSDRKAGTGSSNDEGGEFGLMEQRRGNGGTVWQYVHASAAISANAWVGIGEDGEAAALTQAMVEDGWVIGIAVEAFADNDFGWVCVYSGGNNTDVKGLVGGACAADVALYTSGTAGALDDATSVGTRVAGANVVTAHTVSTSSAAALCIIKWANDPDL